MNDKSQQQRETTDTRMDPELKAKWLAALRSGEYKHCRETLHDGTAYCCLGVLCTLIPEVEWTDEDAFCLDEFGVRHDAYGGLPIPIRGAIGMPHQAVIQLVAMNDGNDGKNGKDVVRAHDFPEIADRIEANL